MKKLFATLAIATTLFGATAATLPASASAPFTKTVYKAQLDSYNNKVIEIQGVDTRIIGKVIEINKTDKYVLVENVLKTTDQLAADFKDVDYTKFAVGDVVQATIDGTSANNDAITKMSINNDVIKSNSFVVYDQEIYKK